MQQIYKIKTTVFSRILSDIVTCELKPGIQIREVEATKRYKTSRTPIREALVELSAKGFVDLVQHKGAIVAPLDAATVFSVFEARIPAEKAATALAAVRATNTERAALKGFKSELIKLNPETDLDHYFAIDNQVHDALIQSSRNTYISGQVKNLRAHTARCWHFYKERGLREDADVDGLVKIIDNVINAEPEAGAEAMRVHLGKYINAYREMLIEQIETLKWV